MIYNAAAILSVLLESINHFSNALLEYLDSIPSYIRCNIYHDIDVEQRCINLAHGCSCSKSYTITICTYFRVIFEDCQLFGAARKSTEKSKLFYLYVHTLATTVATALHYIIHE